MTLYRVDVEETRIWSIYVDAEDAETAESEALELAVDLYPDDADIGAYVYNSSLGPNEEDDVWVGGEDGRFVSYAEYKGRYGA